MPDFILHVDPVSRLAVIVWRAPRPDMRVFRPAFAALLAHPEFRAQFGVISDWRAITETPDSGFVRDFLAHLAAASRRAAFVGPWATLLPRSAPAVYGMGRMTELLSETAAFDYGVFTDEQEARAWIEARLRRSAV